MHQLLAIGSMQSCSEGILVPSLACFAVSRVDSALYLMKICIAVEDAVKCWKGLRDRYRKEKQKYVPSGSGAEAAGHRWDYMALMSFIEKYTAPRRYENVIVRTSELVCCAYRDFIHRPTIFYATFVNF